MIQRGAFLDYYKQMQKRINKKKKLDKKLAEQHRKDMQKAERSAVSSSSASAKKPVKKSGGEMKVKKKNIITLAAVIALTVVFVFCLCNISYLTPSRLPERIKAISANSGSGEGFPYGYDSTGLKSFSTFSGNDLILLNDRDLTVLNRSARPVLAYSHEMAKPILKTSADRILLYDLSSKRIDVLNQSGVLYQTETDYPIICADISQNSDRYVVAVNESGQTKNVYVYSRKNKKIFTWSSGSGYIVDVAISANGAYVAVGMVNTSNAEPYSTVICFDTSSGKQRSQKKLEGTTIYSVDFVTNGNVCSLSSNSVNVTNIKGKKIFSLSLNASTNYQLYTDKSGNIVNLYSAYNSGDYYLDVYSSAGKKKLSYQIGKPLWSYSDGSNVVVLQGDNKAVMFSVSRQDRYSCEFDSSASRIALRGKSVYLVQSGKIVKMSVKRE